MNAMLPSLDARRAKAAEIFHALGVPHRRIEAWKYSDLRSVIDAEKVSGAGAAQWSIGRRSENVELFDLAEPNGIPDWVRQHFGLLDRGNAMDAASLAFAPGGFALRVPRGMRGEVQAHFSSAGQARVLIVLEEGAALTYSEDGPGGLLGLQNIATEIVIGKNAHVVHARIAPERPNAVQIAEVAVTVARDASYRLHCANFGAELSRLELHIALNGEGAEAHLSGVSVLGGEAHADVTTHIVHAVGNTRSTQLFKNVAGGGSRAVYQGKITVREGADGSDSRQTAKALLLGPRAEADLKPELEIFADDVKCAHGAAVGDLDAESLFYLRSRGVPEGEARNLLIRAFLEDAVMGIENDDIRAGIWNAVEAALPRAMETMA